MREPNTWSIARLARRIRKIGSRRALDAAMNDEMQYHIERETAERIERGMSPDEARRSAARDFGGVERYKEDARDERGFRIVNETAGDVAYALRVLRRNPGHAIAVIVTLALGLGCTAAIFSVVNGILLRPLPFASPNQLVVLWERNASRNAERNVVSTSNFEAWRQRARSFSDVVALVPSPVTLGGSPSERLTGAEVSPNYFTLLGIRPSLGRDFTRDDELNGGANVVMLSDAFWRRRFGADSSIVGKSISFDGRPNVVIGVMPPGFDPPRFGWIAEQPFWRPFGPSADNRKFGRFLHVVARLRPGVTIDQARSELSSIADRLAHEVSDDKEWSASVVRLDEQITGDVRRPLLVVFSAVLLLLGMSAVNVASLVTTFSLRRQHELAIRRAIGASGSRLLRQQLAHSGTLGVIGLAAGLLVAVVATRLLVAAMPPDVPRLDGIRVNGTVVLFAVAIAAATIAIIGVAAAVRAANIGPRALTLDTASNRSSPRLGGARVVTAEVAIGLLLSVLAALMMRSFANLRGVDLGFDADAVVSGRVSLPSSRYATDEQRAAFFDQLLRRLRAIPGVSAASLVTSRPFACCAPTTPVSDPAQANQSEASAPTTDVRFADDSYFSAMRISVIVGEVFARNEAREGPPRAVVSRALARALWGSADPIGRNVTMGLWGTTTARVIGVVGDVHLDDPRTPPRPEVYLSTARFPSSERDIVVRGAASTDPNALLVSVREAVASIDAAVPLYRAATLQSSVGSLLAQDRFTTALLGAFASLALLLAAIGVYGVLSGDVASRRKEIGIRLALGADGANVTRLIVGRAVRPTLYGVGLGMVGALVSTRALSAMVFGVGTTDPRSFVVVIAILIAVAGFATLVPALRAARVSPLEAIRTD